jgi:thioredoxin-related protein
MKIEDFNSFFGTRVKLQCITVSDVSIVDVYKLCLEYKELFEMIPFKNFITSFLCNSNLLSFYKEYKDIINQDFKRALNVNVTPHVFIFDKDGKMVYSHTSYLHRKPRRY